jgi:hypothetical protein
MKARYCIALAALVAAPLALFLAAGHEPATVRAQVPQMHLDMRLGGELRDNEVPPECTTWHEMYPVYCTPHHQTGYEDNGDGVISPCDFIWLDGARWHVIWSGPTYFCTGTTGDLRCLEPLAPQPGGDPTCETWQQVYPVYEQYHIDGWQDNGNGVLDDCDVVTVLGINENLHIDSIGVDIIVVPGPTATEQSSWSKVKKLFGKIL